MFWFVHNWYSRCVDHVCKISIGSVPNLSNYGHSLIHVSFCDISEKKWIDFIHSWYSNQVPCVADACKIAFGSMPNLSNSGNIFHKFDVFVVIYQKKMFDFIHIWYSNQAQQELDAYKIYLGSLAKCSIYVHYFINVYL